MEEIENYIRDDLSNSRLIIASNRLPIVLKKEEGKWEAEPGSGGLVTALLPVLRQRGGLWVGWPGTHEASSEELETALGHASQESGFNLKPVVLTSEEIDRYYYGFSNEIIWPQFHDLLGRCNFDPAYWPSYQEVNRKFAEVIHEQLMGDDYIWIHDYHLMSVAQHLRKLGTEGEISFFLHIPFPPPDIFLKLPWRKQLLNDLLNYDLIGFQTTRDRRNFIQCVHAIMKNIPVHTKGQATTVKTEERRVRVGAFPISIDFDEFRFLASSQTVADRAWHIHEQVPNAQIILGIDRLDYTKGIPERLKAFGNALQRYPELREKVVLAQVVVPSRHEIPEYQVLKMEIERLVSEINGQFTRFGWVPIHYLFRSLERSELAAYYRTAEIALITPLKDGMNLIAKEYCASSLEENCVLILSEFAGAASQMQKGALIVNPYDQEGVADAIYTAFKMSPHERYQRMKRLRASIKRHDIYWWVDSFLHASLNR
jgi:trehalose 6-phosphate synthase/phosphatase